MLYTEDIKRIEIIRKKKVIQIDDDFVTANDIHFLISVIDLLLKENDEMKATIDDLEEHLDY